MWEMVTRQTPFSGWNPLQIVRALDRGERLPIPGTCNESFGILITRCWSNEPTLRPLFEEIVTKLRELHLSLSEEEIH
jgi:hypothetical protein